MVKFLIFFQFSQSTILIFLKIKKFQFSPTVNFGKVKSKVLECDAKKILTILAL